MTTLPSGYVTLLGSDEPIMEARVASTRTYGASVSVNVKRRCPTREATESSHAQVSLDLHVPNEHCTYLHFVRQIFYRLQ
jgi:hypothetical protein